MNFESTPVRHLLTMVIKKHKIPKLPLIRSILPLFFLLVFNANGQQVLIDSLQKELRTSKPDSIRQQLFLDLSWEYSFSNLDTAEYFARHGINLALERNDEKDLASAREMLAIIYDIRGSIDEAARLFLEAATYYKDQKLYGDLSSTYNNLGTLFFNNDEIDGAGMYFERSMKIDILRGDSLGVASSLINLASIANRNGDHNAGYAYLLRGKKIINKKPNLWTQRAIYEALGYNHLYRHNYDSAAIYFEGLLPLSRSSTDVNSELTCIIGLVMAHTGQNKFGLAKKYFADAERISNQYKEVYLDRNLKSVGSELFAKMGNYEQAYKYQTLYLAAAESITKEERIDKMNELEQKYQSEQREKEIAKLEIENQRATNQRNVYLFIVAVVIVAAAFLILLLRSRSKSTRIISKSLGEKEILLKEIHHRVKNNLQVISSLLNLQAGSLEDDAAAVAVKEGQNRVRSMALIHQKLYNTDDIRGVDIQDYLETLVSELFAVFGIDDEKIKYEVDSQGIKLDIDTVIPLGLILNELITNVLKYAFQKSESGSLQILLHEQEGKLKVVVKDNGCGMDQEAIMSANSFGWKMIKSLSRKLKAEIEIINDEGTTVLLTLYRYKLVV